MCKIIMLINYVTCIFSETSAAARAELNESYVLIDNSARILYLNSFYSIPSFLVHLK